MACKSCCAVDSDREDNIKEQQSSMADGILAEVVEYKRNPKIFNEQVEEEALRLFEKWKVADKVVENGAFAADDVDPGKFVGAWEEERGNTGVHTIDGATLTWSDGSTANMAFRGSGVKMIYNGKEMNARLDESAERLRWSDGDIWNRAGFKGVWKDGSSGATHVITDSTLTTVSSASQQTTEHLEVKGPTCFSLTLGGSVGGVVHQATLDSSGMTLTWTDGDVWTRARSIRRYR